MLDHFNKDMFLILNHKVVQSVSLNYISLYVIIKPSIVKIKYMNYLKLSSIAMILIPSLTPEFKRAFYYAWPLPLFPVIKVHHYPQHI